MKDAENKATGMNGVQFLSFCKNFLHYVGVCAALPLSLIKTVSSLSSHYYLSLHCQYNLKLWLIRFTVAEKESLHTTRGTAAELRKTAGENSSEEEGELSPKNKRLNNGHGAEAKTVNRRSYSDDSNNTRFLLFAALLFIHFLTRTSVV